jgi:DNA-binding XRE family transcriptional regulator
VGATKTRRTDTPRELLGAAITALRIEKNVSQAVVAAAVGCNEFSLRNAEQGKENLTFDVMYAIVTYFEMLPMSRFWLFAEALTPKNHRTATVASGG